MDIRKETGKIVRWSWSTALGVGDNALRTVGQHKLADQISGQAPEQRLAQAIQGAKRAFGQEVTHLTLSLGRFELRRAVAALKEVDEKVAQDVGSTVVKLALENLPDTDAGVEEVELVTREGFERLVNTENRKSGIVPKPRPPMDHIASTAPVIRLT